MKVEYDPKCVELAQWFLDAYGTSYEEGLVTELARVIQLAMEGWFEDQEKPSRREAMMTDREASISEIRRNLVEVLTGGNHLASVLINRLGAGPELFPPYQTNFDRAQLIVKDPETFDLWIAWRAIMQMRDRLREIGVYE